MKFLSVIKTSERMTYSDVSDILENDDPALVERYRYLLDDFGPWRTFTAYAER